ncbi:MAG: LptF/LptG family permease [Spirochaetia bacterium]
MAGRHYFRISLYVSKEFFFSFLVTFLFFFFIFFVNNMLLLAEEILSKNVPLKEVVKLIIYMLPQVVALVFPFSTLVSALMALGRLSSDNELIAMQTSGIPRGRIFLPMLFIGLILSVTSFVINDYFLPLGNINFSRLYRKLIYSNPELELESNTIKKYQDRIIITGDVSEGNIDDILIIDRAEGTSDQRIISAASAALGEGETEFGTGAEEGVISLRLTDVESHSVDLKKDGAFDHAAASGMIYNILLKDLSFALFNPTAREMSSYDVYIDIQEQAAKLETLRQNQKKKAVLAEFAFIQLYHEMAKAVGNNTSIERALGDLQKELTAVRQEKERQITSRTLQITRLEFFKKFSIPFACIVFVVFAFPVGLLTRKSGRSVGFGIGLIISVLYWGLLIGFHTFGIQQPDFPPFLAMWMPNIVIFILGILFFGIRWSR